MFRLKLKLLYYIDQSILKFQMKHIVTRQLLAVYKTVIGNRRNCKSVYSILLITILYSIYYV